MASFTSPVFALEKNPVSESDYNRLLSNQLSIHSTDYLKHEFLTKTLDELYEHLFWVTTPSHSHIDALHVQGIKRRDIVVALDPALHLIWHGEIIYIKPLPQLLLRPEFWATYLTTSTEDKRRVLGFLRTYAFLVQAEVDFCLAQGLNLLPKPLTYLDFAEFIAQFRHLSDSSVAKRYHFGQMRLTRLNWAVRVTKKGWYYHETRFDTAQYLREYGAVFIFILAILTLALSALQVMAQIGMSDEKKQHAFNFASTVFWSFVGTVVVFLLGILVLWLAQLRYAAKMRRENMEIASLA